MSILYKSSTFETVAYFIIFPILIGICIFFIFGIFSYGSYSLFTIFIIFILLFVLILSTDSFIRLRYIEVTEDSILIKRISGMEIVEFKDVEFVFNLINIQGTSLLIWYKNKKTNKSNVILVRPEGKTPLPENNFPVYSYGSAELEITKFIKDKATKANPNYLYTNKPRWFLFGFK